MIAFAVGGQGKGYVTISECAIKWVLAGQDNRHWKFPKVSLSQLNRW